jgi:hypothetical protein
MCTYVVALACSILGSGIGGDGNKLLNNISSEDVEIKEVYVCVCVCVCARVYICYAQFVAQSFLRQNLSLRM